MATTLTIADERPSNGWAVYDTAGVTLARAPTRRRTQRDPAVPQLRAQPPGGMNMEPWEAKAHRIIAGAAYAAWRQANHDRAGKRYRKHRPYVLPDDAHKLVAILGWHDRKAAEHAAKAMFQALVFRPVD